MDPWDVPEPKTLKSLPKGKQASSELPKVKPAPVDANPVVKEAAAYEPPPLKSQPTDGMDGLTPPTFEVITTPPPARERARVESSPRRVPAPTIIPTHVSEIDEEAPTEEISKYEPPTPVDVSEPVAVSSSGSARMLIAGGVFGVALAAIVLSVIFGLMGDESSSGTVPQETVDIGKDDGAAAPSTPAPVVKKPEAVEEPESAEVTPPEAGTAAAPDEDDGTEELVEQPVDATAAVESTPTVDAPVKKADSVPATVVDTPPAVEPTPKPKVKQKRPRPAAAQPKKPTVAPAPAPPEPKEEPVEELENPWGNLD